MSILKRMATDMYYIQNVGYCGNCIKFWKPEGKGYTMNVDDAWKVTKEEADRICHSRPKEDIPIPASIVEEAAHRHVNIEALRELQRQRNE